MCIMYIMIGCATQVSLPAQTQQLLQTLLYPQKRLQLHLQTSSAFRQNNLM